MVPDIAVFAPAIRSVFGQYGRGDPRYIPFDIADLQERGNNPLLVALEWLLRLPSSAARLSEVRDLLDVPAVAARFGLDAEDLPRLAQWLAGAGVRWGLDAVAARRPGPGRVRRAEHLAVRRCGACCWATPAATAASDAVDSAASQGIQPYGEVGGLDASIAGSLAAAGRSADPLVDDGVDARRRRRMGRARCARCSTAFVAPTDERERMTLAALLDALRGWLDACDSAGFDEPVSLAVAREAWLAGIDEPGLNQRFRAGGVTFCTLLPMRVDPVRGGLPAGHERRRLPAQQPRAATST